VVAGGIARDADPKDAPIVVVLPLSIWRWLELFLPVLEV